MKMKIAIVLILTESNIPKETYGVIGCAGVLANSAKAQISIWLLGGDCSTALGEAVGLPIHKIVYLEDEKLKEYVPEVYLDACVQMEENLRPDLVIFAGDKAAKEISVRFAYRCGVQAVNDCVAVGWRDERLELTKPVYSSNLYINYQLTEKPAVITIRSGLFNAGLTSFSATPSIHKFEFTPKAACSWLKGREMVSKSEDILSEAKTVLICGRGACGGNRMALLKKFAQKIGAQIAGTRPVVHNGWLPLEALVGQSGKKIAPEICIVIGASGATPLMTGISGAKRVIAINSDEHAPIFEWADVGLIGYYEEILNEIMLL
jgi:electron transfer flavoprotein alpha subunit